MSIEHKNRIEIDLLDIHDENGLDLRLEKPFDFFFEEADGINGVGAITVELTLTMNDGEIFAQGRAEATVRLQCSRCLAEYELAIEPEIAAPFFPHSAEARPEEEEDEGEVNFYSGETLDLFPVVHDQLVLALPLKPLCKEDCKGLCPTCGADLNAGKCGCKAKETDGRFAALKKLKERL